MCRARPGTRCSDYAIGTLNVTKRRLERITAELEAYKEKYAESLNKTEDIGARDAIRQQKLERLQQTADKHLEAVGEAEFEYNACPVGQRQLQEELTQATADGNESLKDELEARLEAAQEYRKEQKDNLKTLQTIEENEGPEAAEQKGWEMYEEAVEAETEASIGLEQSSLELEAARAEREEYEKAIEEYRKANRVDTPEEEREQARKRKRQLQLVIVAGAAVLAFALAHQAASGQKSSLFQYGRSMIMRQAMIGGRKVMGNFSKGDKQQLDARERRAETEAEQRAAKAREKVYRDAEQKKIVADRQVAKEQEREAERTFRRQLMEEQREAERQKRQEEYEHYQKLSTIELPPEVTEELKRRVRQPRKRVQQEPVVA